MSLYVELYSTLYGQYRESEYVFNRESWVIASKMKMKIMPEKVGEIEWAHDNEGGNEGG